MRAFIAAEIPEITKKTLLEIQGQFQQKGIKGQWIKPDQMHLTLVFFKQINSFQARQTSFTLKNQPHPIPFHFNLGHPNIFLAHNKPRVLWINLEGKVAEMILWTNRLRQELKNKKIPFDQKTFVPHLTLARFYRPPKNLLETLEQVTVKKKPFTIKQVSLFKSKLAPAGSSYSLISKISLTPS
ncbi:RNA 2',3'-cyclic phosphodiesterase [Patescibacteria group bacterium]